MFIALPTGCALLFVYFAAIFQLPIFYSCKFTTTTTSLLRIRGLITLYYNKMADPPGHRSSRLSTKRAQPSIKDHYTSENGGEEGRSPVSSAHPTTPSDNEPEEEAVTAEETPEEQSEEGDTITTLNTERNSKKRNVTIGRKGDIPHIMTQSDIEQRARSPGESPTALQSHHYSLKSSHCQSHEIFIAPTS